MQTFQKILVSLLLPLIATAPLRAQRALFFGGNVTPSGGGGGGASLVSSNAAQSSDTNSVSIPSTSTATANLVVLFVALAGSGAPTPNTPTDNKSNTWINVATHCDIVNTNDCFGEWYCSPCTVGTGHTFSFTQSGSLPALFMLAFSGARTSSPLDADNGNGTATFDGNCQPAAGVTPGANGEIIVSGMWVQSTTGTYSVDSGITITNSFLLAGGTAVGGGVGYKIQGTAALIKPLWNESGEIFTACTVTAFKVP